MTPIRPLRRDDLPVVASLYAELDQRDPTLPAPGYAEFFGRALLEPPFHDPEIPALVYDDPDDGVVGFLGCHPRPYLHRERPIRLACTGPMVVHPNYRPRGVGALLMRKVLAGPQEMTFNDRMTEEVHSIWARLGGVTDSLASIAWRRVLAPTGYAARVAVRRATGRGTAPGAAAFAALDAGVARRRQPRPEGGGEPLTAVALVELIERLRRRAELRPAYDEGFVEALFAAMAGVTLKGFERRLVRAGDGRVAGAYAAYLPAHGLAEALAVIAAEEDAGLVLDHLFHDAAERGAVEVRGRVEPRLLAALDARNCRLRRDVWTMVQSQDPELVSAVLAGRALLGRFDGEWWMRPAPEPA